jgi:hypothetical protein
LERAVEGRQRTIDVDCTTLEVELKSCYILQSSTEIFKAYLLGSSLTNKIFDVPRQSEQQRRSGGKLKIVPCPPPEIGANISDNSLAEHARMELKSSPKES